MSRDREELARLRCENRRLRMERKILKSHRMRGGITCWTRNSGDG